MWYSQYRGRSVGRILHYCEYYYPSYMRDSICIGDKQISWGGNPKNRLATFEWEGDDTLHFTFDEVKHLPSAKELEKDQFFLKPYVDDTYLVDNVKYIVQEVRNCLKFNNALLLLHIRDRLNGNWDDIQGDVSFYSRIKDQIRTVPYRITNEQVEKMWQHIAMCAVYDVKSR